METTPKELQILFESLMSTMFQMLDLAPGDAWHLIALAQQRVLEAQMSSERRAG